ncbi:MAG TPA: CBS domain-containing protein [Candidatus Limnocylindria bacterium]|nr:CBS domain-containing protein [Candidatus Limnocylindria bacterium]
MKAPARVSLVVRDWMRAHPLVVRPKDSIAHARALCEEHRINQLPVVANKTLIGIITDRDLRDAFPSVEDQARDPIGAQERTDATRVENVMSPRVLTVDESDTVAHAASIMQQERIGALPVLKGTELVGILTRSDLLRALIALAKQAAA